MSRIKVNAATAMFPGFDFNEAVDILARGVVEPLHGAIATDAVQLCPQSMGRIDEAACESLRSRHPGIAFRLHANARVLDRHYLLDASSFNADTRFYFEALADRSRRLGAKVYSLHAGYRADCSQQAMFDNLQRIQDIFGDCVVALEGLYPNAHRPHLMDTWASYEAAMQRGIALAIDLSHLALVGQAERRFDLDLAGALVGHHRTVEIHLSGNDGVRDSHALLTKEPWWWPVLDQAHPEATVFTEANHVRAARRNRTH